MKILIISHMYPNSMLSNYGIFIHHQVLELTKTAEVRVVSPIPWSPVPIRLLKKKWKEYSRIPKKETIDGVEVYHPRYLALPGAYLFEYSGLLHYYGARGVIEEIRKDFKFDLIHCHTALPDGYSGMMLKKRLERPLVVTIHGHDMAYTVEKNKKCERAIRDVFESSEAIVTVSSKLAGLVSRYCGAESKIRVLNNGIDNEKIFRGNSRLKDNYKNKVILLSVAHLIKLKGINYTIEALPDVLKKHKNVILLVVGKGRERKSMEGLVRGLGLQEHVEFLGEKSHKEVMEYMSFCDIFVLPSWNEGFGIVYLEAMASGKPVIACEGEGIEDVIRNNENGVLVKPKDVESLVSALLKLLREKDYSERIGRNAGESIKNGFTWGINATKMMEIFKEVLRNET